jgi:hypothetical protein
LQQENNLLESEIQNLLRRKKNFQDSFDLKLDKQEALIHRLDSDNTYQMSTFEALLMLIKQEDITKTIYDERSGSLEENFQFMQNYLINLDSFVMSIKDLNLHDKENFNAQQKTGLSSGNHQSKANVKNNESIGHSGVGVGKRGSNRKFQG